MPSPAGTTGWSRVRLLAQARTADALPGGNTVPVAGILIHAGLVALLGFVLAESGSPSLFAGGALLLSALLVASSLLGDLAPILEHDPAQEWIGSQPLESRDPERARVLVAFRVVGALGAGGMIPLLLIAPAEFGAAQRGLLILVGAWQALGIAAALTLTLRLAGRHQTLVQAALQTGVLVTLFGGTMAGLSLVGTAPEAARDSAALLGVPPLALGTWLARGGAPSVTALIALALPLLLLVLPPLGPSGGRSTRSIVGTLVSPIAALVEALALGPEARASFRFLCSALPTERDFAVRAWPLGIAPLALLAGGADPATEHGEGLFALAAFAPAAFLPVFLSFVPTTASPEARWVLDVSPLSPRVEAIAGRWAIGVRVLLPLQLVISSFVATQLPLGQVLTWSMASLGTSLVLLWLTWARVVPAPPLSRPVQELGSAFEGGGGALLGNALLACAAALVTWRVDPAPLSTAGALAILLVLAAVGSKRASS